MFDDAQGGLDWTGTQFPPEEQHHLNFDVDNLMLYEGGQAGRSPSPFINKKRLNSTDSDKENDFQSLMQFSHKNVFNYQHDQDCNSPQTNIQAFTESSSESYVCKISETNGNAEEDLDHLLTDLFDSQEDCGENEFHKNSSFELPKPEEIGLTSIPILDSTLDLLLSTTSNNNQGASRTDFFTAEPWEYCAVNNEFELQNYSFPNVNELEDQDELDSRGLIVDALTPRMQDVFVGAQISCLDENTKTSLQTVEEPNTLSREDVVIDVGLLRDQINDNLMLVQDKISEFSESVNTNYEEVKVQVEENTTEIPKSENPLDNKMYENNESPSYILPDYTVAVDSNPSEPETPLEDSHCLQDSLPPSDCSNLPDFHTTSGDSNTPSEDSSDPQDSKTQSEDFSSSQNSSTPPEDVNHTDSNNLSEVSGLSDFKTPSEDSSPKDPNKKPEESGPPAGRTRRGRKRKQGTVVDLLVSNYTKKRSRRCKECGPCKAPDCGRCVFCLDKPKFGGPNKKKNACLGRKCLNMSLKWSPSRSQDISPPGEDDFTQIKEEPFEETSHDVGGPDSPAELRPAGCSCRPVEDGNCGEAHDTHEDVDLRCNESLDEFIAETIGIKLRKDDSIEVKKVSSTDEENAMLLDFIPFEDEKVDKSFTKEKSVRIKRRRISQGQLGEIKQREQPVRKRKQSLVTKKDN